MELSAEIILKMVFAVVITWFVGRYPFGKKKGCCISVLRGAATFLIAGGLLLVLPTIVIIAIVALGGLNVFVQMKKDNS